MSSNYLVADLLSAVKNIKNRYIKRVTQVSHSVFATKVLDLLQESGYIVKYDVQEIRKGVKKIDITISFTPSGMNVISDIKFFSKPSRRFYVGVDELKSIVSKNKAGLVVVSTTKGVKSGADALRNNIGGEIICVIL